MDVKQFSSDKILKHLDKVQAWLDNRDPFAVTVEFDPTNVCNSNCKNCAGGRTEKTASIGLKDGQKIMAELNDLGAKGVTFTGGGEPLCNPDTVSLVKFAKGQGFDIGFITNGILLTKGIGEILLNSCVWIRISLDAGSHQMYKITHGAEENIFNAVLRNISLLIKTKKELNSNTTIGTGFLTAPETIAGISDFVELSSELGVDYAQFRPYHHSQYDPKIEKAIEEAERFSSENFSVLSSKHKYNCMKLNDYGRNYSICYGHQFATVIGADMKMYLCCHMRGLEKFCLGDLRKKTIKEIWDSEQRQKAIQNIKLDNHRECVPLCRCNTFNQVLWNIRQPREHKNFL